MVDHMVETSRPRGRIDVQVGAGRRRRRLEQGAFRWPPISDGVMRLTASQLAALVDGMDWSRLQARDVVRPTAVS
jgi:transposase